MKGGFFVMSNSQIWDCVLNHIQESKLFDIPTFNSYIKESFLYEINDESAIIEVPYTTNKTFFQSYLNDFENLLSEEIGRTIKCKILLKNEILNQGKKKEEIFEFENGNKIIIENSFENFIQGASNKAAYTACISCINNMESITFNPLFIYGNSGLGKTHLLHAICNYLRVNKPNTKYLYIDGNDLISLIIKSLYHKKSDKLIKAMSELDFLLIDDIQHLAKTNDSQELFFNIYNKLIADNKKVIITSDVYPSELNNINNRIISRFTSGLSVGIDSPEFETAVSILYKKLEGREQENIINEEALYFIAKKFNEDVRKLEGALNELLFKSILYNPPIIDEAFAKECFKDNPLIHVNDEITPAKIKKIVCSYYNITKKQIESKSRTADIANARHIAVYLCRELLDMPFKKIGNEFGGRDHSTIMASYEKMNKLIDKKDSYRTAIEQIKIKLNVN